ncbi:lytic transglycosylase domain-containing protein [Alkalicoccobacillus gibsonii]|uniref:lytic transglycosylase domain-containing protein n=2 Tax=Alkalicoccobacillus gibsonii TaxID=79881 RepID=UPI00280BC861|nr:lytic transglycosylase domain-containing protein [Alkalicoccobacillus gibsonii]
MNGRDEGENVDYSLLHNQLVNMRNQTQLSWVNQRFDDSTNRTNELFSDVLQNQLNQQPMLEPSRTGISDLFLSQTAKERFELLQQQVTQTKEPVASAVSSNASEQSFPYKDLIDKAAARYSLDPKLLYAVIKQESNFNPNAKSHAGASGLMQLMPATARGLGVQNIFDPEQNINGGAKYLKSMLTKYNGSIEKALAAYNAGPGNVDKYNGIPPFKETMAYVPKVMNTFQTV